MRTSLLFLAIAGLAVARPLVDETQGENDRPYLLKLPARSDPSATVSPSIQQEYPQGDPYGQLQVSHVDGDDEEDLPPGTGSACNKVFGAMKGLLNKQLTNSKLIPWQPAVPAWWKQNDSDMLQQVVTVHKVASDDFDAYVLCTSSSYRSCHALLLTQAHMQGSRIIPMFPMTSGTPATSRPSALLRSPGPPRLTGRMGLSTWSPGHQNGC